jgi:hypothetical protein
MRLLEEEKQRLRELFYSRTKEFEQVRRATVPSQACFWTAVVLELLDPEDGGPASLPSTPPALLLLLCRCLCALDLPSTGARR